MTYRLAAAGTVLTLAGVLSMAGTGAEPPKEDAILQKFAGEFVALTPGKDKFPAAFTMGDKGDAVKVTLKAPFAVAKYEVTQELYEAVAGKNPSRWKGPRNAVEMVSWDEANDFCAKVTAGLRKRKLIAETEVVRLPSEAEWEYACRAGTATAYSFGDAEADLGAHGWFTGNAKGNDPPVGQKKPNPWGLHDTHGYVGEWCGDAWAATHKGASAEGTPRGGDAKSERVVRGGAWTSPAAACRSASRDKKAPDHRGPDVGFRCVKAAAPGKE